MAAKTRPTLSQKIGKTLQNNRSPLYTVVALLFYAVPVVIISLLLIDVVNQTQDTVKEVQLANPAFVALTWVIIVFFPLMLTFGVFIVYRSTYSTRAYLNIDEDKSEENLTEEETQWNSVINRALDWHRFLLPLSLLNMFITVITGLLLYIDIQTTGSFWLGATTLPLVVIDDIGVVDITTNNTIGIPGSVFYLGLIGFLFQFLESTRRRYVSRNIVPRFYLISAFRVLQVMMVVVIVFLAVQILIPDPPLEVTLLAAFLVGMFPLQVVTPVLESTRARLGMDVAKGLPITLINGIDSTLESLLQEENIDSVQILATTQVEELHKRTAIPKAALADWRSQARLFNALGTEVLIHRFARIGINDIDDLGILVPQVAAMATVNVPSTPTAEGAAPSATTTTVDGINSILIADFTEAMIIEPDEKAMATKGYWRVLIQVLVQEYLKKKAEDQASGTQYQSPARTAVIKMDDDLAEDMAEELVEPISTEAAG